MLKRVSALTLIILVLTSHFSIALTFTGYGAEETDALTALRLIEEELKKGKIPSGSITEACFTVPEGFPAEFSQRLWFFIAQLVSMGFSEEEMRRTIKGANDTLKLPARIDYGLKDYSIIPEYEKIHIRRSNDGSVSVEIPYRVVDKDGNENDASSIRYESNGTNVFHVLHRYPKKRTYLIRLVDPDSYTFTFIDPETGEIFNKTASIKIGLFPNASQGCFLENFLIAVPGHFEDTREVVGSQVSEFRVLLPAYDPISVDTSISSTRVGIGDTITITAQIRNPQEIRGNYMIMLGARLSDKDAFEAWAPPPGPSYLAPLYLKAKKHGTYTVTVYFAVVEPSNLDVVFWNGGKTVTYTVEVLPEPPRLEIRLSSQAVAKFANLSITLINKGGQRARNVKLFITGDVDEKELEIGTIVGLWSKNVVTKLLSPIAKVNVTVVYYDEEGERYASTALTTISTTNFITPEEWRSYVVEVEGYNETKRVFVPGYQAATHLKLYFMATGMVPGYLSGFDGVRLIPISPDGFTLTLENSSYFSKTAKTLDVKYALIDIKPSFLCERILREDEVKRLLSIPEDEGLEPGKVPSNYEVKLLKEEVLNQSETLTVSDEFYEWLKYNGWEDHDYKYEDTGETRWDLDKATASVSHGKEIELVYRPLAYGGGSLIQGVLVKNYAACNVEYVLEASSGPMRVTPERRTINVSAFGSIPLQLVQLEDVEYPIFISLKHGDRIVATLQVSFRRGELPWFWRGFWDGFASKGLGIVATCGIMIIVGFVLPPKWAAAASLGILATGVATNILEIWTDVHSALSAMDLLNGLADVCEGRAKEFNEIGMTQHANELSELAQVCRLEARDIDDNLLSNVFSNLALDVSWDEIRLAFGLREQPSTKDKDYRVGYATGRIVGAIVSCAAYATTFYAMVSNIRAERIGGKPLSVKDILRIVGRGVYNWITPAIWDAVMLKLKPYFHKVTDLLLGNKYSREFGDIIGDLVERINNPLVVEKTLETVSRLSKHVLENVPSRESSGRILDAIGAIIKHYSPEELEEKGGAIARSIVSIWIKDGDGAVESLNNWLSANMRDPAKMNVLEKVLLEISGDPVNGVGLKIGSIVDSYLDVKGKYGEDVAEAFLGKALKHPSASEDVFAKSNVFDFTEKPREITLKKDVGVALGLGKGNEVEPGTYIVRIHWEYGDKNGVVGAWIDKKVKSDEIALPIQAKNDILEEIGKDEATVSITKVELLDYRLFFPTEFIINGERIRIDLFDNEVEIHRTRCKFNANPSTKGGRLHVDIKLEGKNIEGKNLELSFYQDSEVRIKYGDEAFPIEGIEVDSTGILIRIKYLWSKGREYETEYNFNLKPLDEQLGKHPCEIIAEEQGRVSLKGELFRLLGYDALKELEGRITTGDKERKIIILAYFDNGKIAHCGNKEVRVRIPSGGKRITSIDIVTFKQLVDLKQYAIDALDNPTDKHSKGLLGEAIVHEKLMSNLLEEASKRSSIPKERIKVEWLGERIKEEGPDFVMKDAETNKKVVIVEAKYISNPEDVKNFRNQIEDAEKQVSKYLNSAEWAADYGVIVVISWPPEDVLDDIPYPAKVGEFNNPYIEWVGRKGG